MARASQSTNTKKYSADVVVIYTAVGITFFSLALLFILLCSAAFPLLIKGGEAGPFSWTWAPYSQQFGILPMLCDSILLSISTLILAFPISLAIASWLVAIAQGPLRAAIQSVIYFMTAIPTIIYGFVALFLLTPLIRDFYGGTGLCWLSAMLMLTILILPTMILVMQSGLQTQLGELRLAGLAMGFSPFVLLWFFILPNAKKTLLASCGLGFGRAMGDTLLPLMLAGNATQVPTHLSDSLRTLSAHMALVTANEVGSQAYGSLFVACFLLLLINALVSLFTRRLEARQP